MINRTHTQPPVLLLTGATGQIGRRILLEWLKKGYAVVVTLRAPSQQWPALRSWLHQAGASTENATCVQTDFAIKGFGWDAQAHQLLGTVTCVVHLAAMWGWNLCWDDAERVNVKGTLNLHQWAVQKEIPGPFISACGFKSQIPGNLEKLGVLGAQVDWVKLAKEHGAYEISKVKAYVLLHPDSAHTHTLPVTWIHPAAVIADNSIPEVPDHAAIAGILGNIHKGHMRFVPGTPAHKVPWVTGNYVANYTVALALAGSPQRQDHLLLDPSSPSLMQSVTIMARAIGASKPWGHASLPLFNRLLKIPLVAKIMNASSESLGFIVKAAPSSRESIEWGERHGVFHPDIIPALETTARYWIKQNQSGYS
jgi:nucleoside-diphosphate-sugar epimerase